MRVTPLICWHCSTWFIPKTKRKNKYCSGACRQQGYLKNLNTIGYETLIQFNFEDEDQEQEIASTMKNACVDGRNGCVECLFEHDYKGYCMLVAKYGRDYMGNSMTQWLQFEKGLL